MIQQTSLGTGPPQFLASGILGWSLGQRVQYCSKRSSHTLGHAPGLLVLGVTSTYTTFWRLQVAEAIFSQRIPTDEVLRKL